MTATSRIGTGRSAEFADSAGGSGGLSRDISYIAKIDGPVGLGGLAAIAGTLITVVLPVTGKVSCFASFTAYSNGGSNLPASTHLYIRIDGIDYEVSGNTLDIGVPGPSYADSVSGVYAITLSAGSHTFQIAAAGNTNMFANPANPAVLVVEYPILTVPVTTASPITSQEAQNATGTPTTNATTTYAVIPGTLINLTLSGIQTVFFSGLATADVVTDLNAQLGVRIDGIDYDGTCSVHDNLIAVTVDGSVDVTKAISLTAGAHTAQLVIRRAEGVVAGSAQVFNSSTKPSRLTAVYTTPQVAGDGVVEGARVTKSTSTVLAASTPTVLTWDTVLNNSNGVYSGGSPTRLTAITGGWYSLAASISWNSVAFTTTIWSLKARKNGSTIIGQDVFFSAGAFVVSIFPDQNKVNELVYLNAGDYVELIAETTEPSFRNTIVSSAQYSPIFSLVLIQTSVAGSGGAGSGGANLAKQEVSTGTPFTSSSTSYVIVTGSTLTFTLSEIKTVELIAQFPITGIFATASDAFFGLKIDGVDTPISRFAQDNAGQIDHMYFSHVLELASGTHTISIIGKITAATYQIDIPATSTNKIVLTALYTEPVVAVGAITTLEAENATGTPTTNATTTYAVIPSTLINFSLSGTQTVFFDGFVTVQTPSTRYNTQIGIRIDGVDYDGPAVLVGTIFSVTDLAGLTASKAISLAAGAHTAQLVLREAGGTGSAEVANSALKPSRLTALYTVPQSIPAADFAFVQATATGGEFDTTSATFVDVTGTTVNFSTLATRNVIVKAQFTGIRQQADTDITAFYALNIDGTDYNMGGLKLSLSAGFNGFWVQSFEKIIALAAGSHTAVLRLKSNGANNSRIASDTDKPTVVTVQYMV